MPKTPETHFALPRKDGKVVKIKKPVKNGSQRDDLGRELFDPEHGIPREFYSASALKEILGKRKDWLDDSDIPF